jgi:hypothetical protein
MSGGTAHLYNNNIIDAAIVTIVFCVLVATVFGADFFFLLFWPQRRYPRWYDVTKLLVAVVVSLGMAAAALMSTVSLFKFRSANVLSDRGVFADRHCAPINPHYWC